MDIFEVEYVADEDTHKKLSKKTAIEILKGNDEGEAILVGKLNGEMTMRLMTDINNMEDVVVRFDGLEFHRKKGELVQESNNELDSFLEEVDILLTDDERAELEPINDKEDELGGESDGTGRVIKHIKENELIAIEDEVLAIIDKEQVNETEELLNMELSLALYNQEPYKIGLAVDIKEGKFKTSVYNPKVLGKPVNIEAGTFNELKEKLKEYYKSIKYDVEFEGAKGGYVDLDSENPQITYKSFEESVNEVLKVLNEGIEEISYAPLDVADKAIIKDELDAVYKGYGWITMDQFIEDLQETDFKAHNTESEIMNQEIEATGLAKVVKVKDIKNPADLEDFDPIEFDSEDLIIVTKDPALKKFNGESKNSIKNEEIEIEPEKEYVFTRNFYLDNVEDMSPYNDKLLKAFKDAGHIKGDRVFIPKGTRVIGYSYDQFKFPEYDNVCSYYLMYGGSRGEFPSVIKPVESEKVKPTEDEINNIINIQKILHEECDKAYYTDKEKDVLYKAYNILKRFN